MPACSTRLLCVPATELESCACGLWQEEMDSALRKWPMLAANAQFEDAVRAKERASTLGGCISALRYLIRKAGIKVTHNDQAHAQPR